LETEGENNNDQLETLSNEDENGETLNDEEYIDETIDVRDSGIVRPIIFIVL
jgi:hypothetical protein